MNWWGIFGAAAGLATLCGVLLVESMFERAGR